MHQTVFFGLYYNKLLSHRKISRVSGKLPLYSMELNIIHGRLHLLSTHFYFCEESLKTDSRSVLALNGIHN